MQHEAGFSFILERMTGQATLLTHNDRLLFDISEIDMSLIVADSVMIEKVNPSKATCVSWIM